MKQFRVGLTCDFLRFVPQGHVVTNNQNINLAWLAELLRLPLSQASSTLLTVITAPEDPTAFRQSLASESMLADYQEDPEMAWARRYDLTEREFFEPLFASLREHDLIVGFEIPPTLKRQLNSDGKRYLSLYIHPIRFLRDLCFGASTNCPDIAQVLSDFGLGADEIARQAARFSALFTRLRLPAYALPSAVPILIGQTARDSVLVQGKKFAEWSDFEPAIATLLSPFDTIAFLEHPYQPNSAKTIEFLRNTLQKTVIATRGNSYGLIFSNRPAPLVLTLASSLGVEAEAIGHRVHYLLSDPRKKVLVAGVDQPVVAMLGHDLLEASFWQAIIDGGETRDSCRNNDGFFLGDNFVRNTIDSWAYCALQHGLKVEPAMKTLAPSVLASAGRLNRLAALCCGASESEDVTPEEVRSLARVNGIELRMLAPPLAPSQTLDLPITASEGAYYLVKGFHAPESWGVWSSEHCSTIIIPLATTDDRSARLRIKLEITISERIAQESPVLRVSAGNRAIGILFFRPSSSCSHRLNFDLEAEPPFCQLDFDLTDLRRPSSDPNSPDTRMLGFGLSRVSIEYLLPTAESLAAGEPECQLWGN